MKGLGIELCRKDLDLVRVYRMRAARKSAPDRKVIQKKPVRRAFAADFAHRSLQASINLHNDSYSAMWCQCSARTSAAWLARLHAVSLAWANGGACSFCATPCLGCGGLMDLWWGLASPPAGAPPA